MSSNAGTRKAKKKVNQEIFIILSIETHSTVIKIMEKKHLCDAF
jgi:hypothetical protein